MKQFLIFVRKEFAHVFRDRKTLFILFGMPVMQILIFGFALTNEIKNSRLVIIDQAHDALSEKMIARIEASRYFEITRMVMDPNKIKDAFAEGTIKLAVVFPDGFNNTLLHEN